MAISKKGKRIITVDAKKYLWWIFEEHDQREFDGIQIKIVAENQIGYIKYGLQQRDKERYVVLSLRDEKYKVHILSPKFEEENCIIMPAGISRLIKWCLDTSATNSRVFVYGYNPAIGIIPEKDWQITFERIVKVILNYSE